VGSSATTARCPGDGDPGQRQADRTGRTWPKIRAELDRLHTITFTGAAGTFRQTTELTKVQRDLLTALKLDPPKKIIELATTL
jgi:hypothetical protein